VFVKQMRLKLYIELSQTVDEYAAKILTGQHPKPTLTCLHERKSLGQMR
jgi:hypothetical protein